MNIIEQIKAEVERLKAKYRKDMYKSNHEGLASGYKIEAYNELLSFLSTLETETPINQEELEVELDIWRHIHFDGARDGHFSGEYLERSSQLELARHFAKWGAEHLKV